MTARIRQIALAALLVLLVGADRAPRAAEDAPRVLSFSALSWPDGRSASDALKKVAAELVASRCKHAGLDGVTAAVGPNGVGVEVRVPASLAASEAVVRRLVERRGVVEFRVRAEAGFEQEHRERKIEGVPPPKGHTWFEDERGGLAALLETPELAAAATVQELARKGNAPDAPELVAAMSELSRLQGENRFGNEDVAATSVQRSISTHGAASRLRIAVRFELKESRKPAFEKYTGAHVGRGLAVVVDGKVHVCPVIKAAIPGEGLLIGPGGGYTDEEAQEMAALLACGPMPCRLVAEKSK